MPHDSSVRSRRRAEGSVSGRAGVSAGKGVVDGDVGVGE